MTEVAPLVMRASVEGGEKAVNTLDNLATTANKAEKATDSLAGGSRRLGTATAQMLASIEAAVRELVAIQRAQQQFTMGLAEGAAAAMREAQALNTATAATNNYAASATRAAAASNVVSLSSRRMASDGKLAAHEVSNLGRQFADVAVMLASGQNPFMTLLQQGPQVADVFHTAGQRGLGFGAVMRQIGGMIAPFAPALLAIGAAAGVAFGTAGLTLRAFRDEQKEWLNELDLSEKQLKRIEDKSLTLGDVMKAAWMTAGDAIKAVFGPALKEVADNITGFLDSATKNIVSGFWWAAERAVVGFYLIRDTWKLLPGVMGELASTAASNVVNAIEAMVNKAIAGINKLIAMANSATAGVRGKLNIPGLGELGSVEFGNVPVMNQGATLAMGRQALESAERGVADTLRARNFIERRYSANLEKLYKDRMREEGGDGPAARKVRERAAPRDTSEERAAQIQQMIEQAKAEQLRAELALTTDIAKRAAIEKQIATAAMAQKQAQVDRVAAAIRDDKGLSEAKRRELLLALGIVGIMNQRTLEMQQQAIDEQKARDRAKEEFSLKRAGLENEADLLEAQQSLAKYEFQREEGAIKLLKIRQQLEKLAIQEALASEKLTKVQREILEARLKQLDAIHSVQLEAAAVTAEQRFNNVSNALKDMADAIRSRDWFAAAKALFEAIGQIRNAFSKPGWKGEVGAGKIGAIAGIADMAGQAIGGTAGAVLSGGASGAMAGLTLAPLLGLAGPVGAIAGAILGGIFGGIGADKQKKAQKAEEERRRREEAARVEAERAQQARELEIMLMQESGDVLGALAAQRQLELDSIHPTNRALAEQVQAMKEAKAAQEQYNGLFLSENERLLTVAQDTGRAMAQLGFTGVTSMEQFKKLADGIDRSTASGAQLFSALMSLGPAFAQVAGYIASIQGAAAALTPYQAAQAGVTAAQGAVTAAEAKVAAAQAALQQAIQAQTQANTQAAQAAQRVAQQFRSLADSLARYRQTLTTGDAARLSPEEAYKQAKVVFDGIQGKTDAESLGKLQQVSEDYRQASEAYYGSSLGYFKDLEKIKAAVDLGAKHADQQATAAEAQVAQLEAANAALNTINGSVLSVEEAQQNLLKAQEELRLAQEALQVAEAAFRAEELSLLAQIRDAISGVGANVTPSQGAWTAEGYLAKNPDVRDHWFTLTQKQRDAEGVHTIEAWARKHWDGIGRSEGRQFATGGSFTVGGVGGPDSQFMPLWLTPGEMVDIRRPGVANDNADVVAAIHSLGARLERIEQSLGEDKAQRAAIHHEAQGALGEVKDELSTIKRKVSTK